jgi:hypothetical protein
MFDPSLSDPHLFDASLSDPSPSRASGLPATALQSRAGSKLAPPPLPVAQSNIGYGPRFRKSVCLLGRAPHAFAPIAQILTQLKCEVRSIDSTEHLSELTAAPPCLVIIAAADRQWATAALTAIRQQLDQPPVTVVVLEDQRDLAPALTQVNGPIDGYLFQPLDRCVLGSLLHAAAVRQFC